MKRNRIGFILLLGLYLCNGCDEAIEVTLDASDNKLVDSLYTIASADLKLELDSICAVNRKVWMKKYKDSIKQERLIEISKLLQE